MSPSYFCILFLKQSCVVVLNYVNILGSEALFFFFPSIILTHSSTVMLTGEQEDWMSVSWQLSTISKCFL